MISVMIAIVIIGVSVTAMMTHLASGTKAQAEAVRVSTGIRLAQNIHEYALTLDHTAVKLGSLQLKKYMPVISKHAFPKYGRENHRDVRELLDALLPPGFDGVPS